MQAESSKLEFIAERVIQRLKRRRVAVIWPYGEGVPLPDSEKITWVHYIRGFMNHSLSPVYDLSKIERIDQEIHGISMIVLPSVGLGVIAELNSGFPVSPEALFAFEGLERSIPVIMDCSHMHAILKKRPHSVNKNVSLALHRLSIRGITFIGYDTCSLEHRPNPSVQREDYYIEKTGWYSWQEISSDAACSRRVVLGRGVRLTPEASERLRRLHIPIIEMR